MDEEEAAAAAAVLMEEGAITSRLPILMRIVLPRASRTATRLLAALKECMVAHVPLSSGLE